MGARQHFGKVSGDKKTFAGRIPRMSLHTAGLPMLAGVG
jgi:hypothetical protein